MVSLSFLRRETLSKEVRKQAKIRSSDKKGGLPAQIPAYSVDCSAVL